MGQDETYGPTKKTQDTIKYLCDIRDQLQKGEAQWEKVAQPIDPDELLRRAEQRGKRRRNKQKARSPAPAPAPTTPITNPSTLEPNAISTISQEASHIYECTFSLYLHRLKNKSICHHLMDVFHWDPLARFNLLLDN